MSSSFRLLAMGILPLVGCLGPDTTQERTPDAGEPAASDAGPTSAEPDDAGPALGTDGGEPTDAGPALQDGGNLPAFGEVRFVPLFEVGTPWDNVDAQQMARGILDDIAARMHTNGPWDAELVVSFTNISNGFGYTTFGNQGDDVEIDGVTVRAVRAWQKVVLGREYPAAEPAGHDDADFIVHINIAENADNAGLIRHEVMHGLGAVGINWPQMSEQDVLSGLVAGDRVTADIYSRHLVDRDGSPLLGDFDPADNTFAVQTYTYDATFTVWTDGEAGLFFRGVDDDGAPFDMPLGTAPQETGAVLRINEPADLMSASVHPDWDHVAAPDRAFLRAMGYPLFVDD